MECSRDFSDHRREQRWATALLSAVAAALIACGSCPAGAQDAGDPPKLQILLTPYFWVAHVKSRVQTPIPQVPTVTQDIDSGQIFSHLSWIPFMGSAELRYGQFGALVDYMHLPLRSSNNTRNTLFSGATSDLVLDVGTAVFLYRPIEQPQQYFDVGVGVRPWGVETNISFNSGLLPGRSIQPGGSWADPLIAARYHRELAHGFGLTVYGDVGGFGLAAHTDWQVIGTIDYMVRPGMDVHLGYRSLNVNYSTKHNVGFDENINGPIIAATFRF